MNAKANRGHRVRYRPAPRASRSRLGSGGAWQPRIAMPVDPATTLTGANEDHVTSLDWGHPLAFLQPARACEHEEHVLGLFMDVLGELVAGLIPGVVDGDMPSADLA